MYPTINNHRIPFDLDGTEIGYRTAANSSISTILANGINTWLSESDKQNLNSETRTQSWGKSFDSPGFALWFFFPEVRAINQIAFFYPSTPISTISTHTIQGSTDTTNGMDGTWETASYSFITPAVDLDYWRKNIMAVSFSGPVKALRIALQSTGVNNSIWIQGLHLYGTKASGEQPDDILFCDAAGTPLTTLTDWGDQPEGTTEIQSIKLKNASASKIATDISLLLNHSDFAFSFSESGPWQSSLAIASLGPESLSSLIYVRNSLNPPLLTLGPKAARLIATVGSWT